MRFAAALSEHPIPSLATGEVVGALLEQLDGPPDLAILFVSRPHVGAIDDIAATVHALLRPTCLLGATAVSVVGGDREIEEVPAIALWAAQLGPVEPIRLDAVGGGDGWEFSGLDARASEASALLLLADPATFPADAFLREVEAAYPHLSVIGGMASAAVGPGGDRLILDGEVQRSGAVGVLLDATQAPQSIVSQGCRPIGDPFTVTRAERNIVAEIAGVPALDKLLEVVRALPEDERLLAQEGLHIGRVVDEHRMEFTRGDFLVRNVLGADRDIGAIAVGDVIEVGATIQFHVRDAASADEDLRLLLAGTTAEAALLFTCNGRGIRLFDEADHDAALVSISIDGGAVAGMFCAGEIGPVGGRSFVHGFTASIALFG